jgi:uncharacterized protein (TIGR02646 family)
MRYIARLSKPQILEEQQELWTKKLLQEQEKLDKKNELDNKEKKEKAKTNHKAYGHDDIRTQLNDMSFYKCFYCEQLLKGVYQEIDHYIESSERLDLTYDWDNLYLACENCNTKKTNKEIPVENALNPCKHTDQEIAQHLTFEEEFVISRTDFGAETIKKFRLSTPFLDNQRAMVLKKLYQVERQIHKNQIQEGRKEMTEEEKAALRLFGQPDRPFSLMFRIWLNKNSL